MKNYIQPGVTLSLTAPADIASGKGVLIGSIFGVAVNDVKSGEQGEFTVAGVFELPKTSAQAWTLGAKIYWDAGTSKCTTAAAAGVNALIGVATVVAANPSDTGIVLLSGAFTI